RRGYDGRLRRRFRRGRTDGGNRSIDLDAKVLVLTAVQVDAEQLPAERLHETNVRTLDSVAEHPVADPADVQPLARGVRDGHTRMVAPDENDRIVSALNAARNVIGGPPVDDPSAHP